MRFESTIKQLATLTIPCKDTSLLVLSMYSKQFEMSDIYDTLP